MKPALLLSLLVIITLQLSAQIQVIGINETVTTPHAPQKDSKAFDINNDGTDELSIVGTRTDSLGVRSLVMQVYSGTRVQAFGTVNFIMRYFVGDQMDSASYISTNDSAIFYFSGDLDYYTFAGGGDLYAAVSFHFDDSTHYGWMKVSVAGDGSSLTFKEAAWQETAGKILFAGQETAVGIPVHTGSKEQIVIRNLGSGEVRLANLTGFRNYMLFSGTGALLASGAIANSELQLTRPPGIYILHLAGDGEPVHLKLPFR